MLFRNMLGTLLFSSNTSSTNTKDKLFENTIGYHNVKKLFRMALESAHNTSILLSGPPASAKTLFLQCLMKVHNSYFIDCSNATKSGVIDYIFDHKPKYLLLDEVVRIILKLTNFCKSLIATAFHYSSISFRFYSY
jgi:hypothetical protein